MTTTVGRLYRFRGVHSLPDFPEPWCFPHEHDYTVEVVVAGGVDTSVIDRQWADLKFSTTRVVAMNGPFRPSTVENIAETILHCLVDAKSVTVWEDRQRWGRAER